MQRMITLYAGSAFKECTFSALYPKFLCTELTVDLLSEITASHICQSKDVMFSFYRYIPSCDIISLIFIVFILLF